MNEEGLKEEIVEMTRFAPIRIWEGFDSSCKYEQLINNFSETFKGIFWFGYDSWGIDPLDDCCMKTLEDENYIKTYKGYDNKYYVVLGSRFLDLPPVFSKPYKTKVSARKRFKVLERDNYRCTYCGVSRNDNEVELHVDHIIPRKYGGRNDMDNLTTACITCNLGKGDRLINMEGVKHVLTKSRKSNDSI